MKSKNKRAITAVVTNDYFHHAVFLWHSLKRFEKKSDFIVFVIGYDQNDPNYQTAEFTVLDAKKLNSQEWDQFVFQYQAKHASWALKPLAILSLLERYEKVIYLDTDMKLFSTLKTAWEALEHSDLSLTPHYYKPIPPYWCDEDFRLIVRLSGTFNAGYIGATQAGSDFLIWWWEQLKYNCITAIIHGISGDQRWLDHAVGLVQRLHVVQDRSYNVAYWNLHERNLEKKKGIYLVNNEPLTLFHFAGIPKNSNFAPQKKEHLFIKLFRNYQKELRRLKENFLVKEYPFCQFQDGELIDNSWREWMRRGIPELEEIKNPFLLDRLARERIEETMLKRPYQFRPKLEREI